jgi:inorganic triphosphatase YgiF
LAKAVAGLRAGERLDPVATVKTSRTAYRVLNADGELVLEIADDQVASGPPDGGSTLSSWREVEIELGAAGNKKDLTQARKLLQAAGATPSTIRTKLDRALGPISSDGQAPAAKAGTVGELVATYVAAQCVVLASNDIGLRIGAPVVHQTRVAARRLRSTLRVFGDVVDTAPAEELNNELAWYAELLGQVRDREVLNTRLTELIADLPPEQVRGPVEAEITKTLAKERDDGLQRLNAAMRTRRYQHLVQLLRGWKPHRRSPTRLQGRARRRSNTQPRPSRRRTNGYATPTTTSSGCTGRAKQRSGCATPPSSSSRPTNG